MAQLNTSIAPQKDAQISDELRRRLETMNPLFRPVPREKHTLRDAFALYKRFQYR